jgi:RNA polymerase sigma-70 factor (ECF subfamily)
MKPMRDRRCQRIFAALSEYLDGDLPVKDCRELEQHLQGCKPCLAYIESLKISIQACRRFRVAGIPKPPAKVYAAFRKALGTR